MAHGIPQGSVLGHLLFLIYINDLHTCILNSDVFHFADDTNLLHISKHNLSKTNIRKINWELNSLNNWLLVNKISLNASKTEIIIFRKKDTLVPEFTKMIKMCGISLILSSEIKYLGLIFDEHITWLSQLQNLNAKLNRANHLLAKSRHYMPQSLVIKVTVGFVDMLT